MIKKLVFNRWILSIYIFVHLACLLSVYVPPAVFWPAVFLNYSIPVILGLDIIILLLMFIFIREHVVYPVIALIIFIPFIPVTWHPGWRPQSGVYDLSVMSLNAKLFRKHKTYSKFSFEMIKWAAGDTSVIKCFQEYSTNSRWKVLDVTRQIAEKGYEYYAFRAPTEEEHNPGLAIFSKYKILERGVVWQNRNSLNAGIYVDVEIKGRDIRVYNVHLASMYLQLYQYKSPHNYLWKVKRLITQLKYGALRRSAQIDKLIDHARKSPYPYIICGDFNEIPYSYNYFKLKRYFGNAFESAGRGFGFSFNGILFFLRIDHQFYGEGITPVRYRVDRNMKISDHFPTRGWYKIDK